MTESESEEFTTVFTRRQTLEKMGPYTRKQKLEKMGPLKATKTVHRLTFRTYETPNEIQIEAGGDANYCEKA